MANILTENQRILTRYLAAVGCQKAEVLYMVAALWEEDSTLEMLEFCKNNPSASPAQLVSAASKIYSKYERATERQNGGAQERRPSAALISCLKNLLKE